MHEAFNYALWDVGDEIPARSRLFHLPMEGTDGRDQESLLDYCQRLAAAHTVPILQFLKAEIIPCTEIRSAIFTTGFSREYSKTFNGYGKYAEHLSCALGKLTMVEDLRRGTFLNWRPMFDPKGGGLLHPKRRWCPSCIVQARDSNRPISHSLIWSSAAITHCPIHATSLCEACPSCGSAQHFLGDALVLGHCCNCGSFLGQKDGLWEFSPPTSRQCFMMAAVAEMISLGQHAGNIALPSVFADSVKAYCEARFDGSVLRLEREIGFRKQSILKWVSMQTRPQFDQFLELCYRVDVMPTQLLSSQLDGTAYRRPLRSEAVPVVHSRPKLSEAAVAALRMDCENALQSMDTYVAANAMAARHGLRPLTFKYRYPELYAQISAHGKQVLNNQSLKRQEREKALATQIVQRLYDEDRRITRHRLDVAFFAAKLSLRNPELRAIAFAERSRLENLGVGGDESSVA